MKAWLALSGAMTCWAATVLLIDQCIAIIQYKWCRSRCQLEGHQTVIYITFQLSSKLLSSLSRVQTKALQADMSRRLCRPNCQLSNHLNGSVKELNKFHIYETEKITCKASGMAEYIELFGSFTRDRHARCI